MLGPIPQGSPWKSPLVLGATFVVPLSLGGLVSATTYVLGISLAYTGTPKYIHRQYGAHGGYVDSDGGYRFPIPRSLEGSLEPLVTLPGVSAQGNI